MAGRRLLIVHNRYREPGGEETAAALHREFLEDVGWTVATFERDSASLSGSFRASAAAALNAPFSVPVYREALAAIRGFRPDVVHVHNLFPLVTPAVYAAARSADVPVVHTLHNFRLLCVNGLLLRDGAPCRDCVGRSPWKGALCGCLAGSRAASAVAALVLSVHRVFGTWRNAVDRYIALSGFSRDLLVQGGLPEEKIEMLPNGIDVAAITPSYEPGGPLVYAGRLSREKGVELLLEAYALYRRQGGRRLLQIIGDGPLRDIVESARARFAPGEVSSFGWMERAERLRRVREAAAFVFPSLCYENCPYVVIESLACGTPVIVPDHGGAREMADPGENGEVFQPGNAAELASAMFRAGQNGESNRRAARRRAEIHYSKPAHVAGLLAIYERARQVSRRGLTPAAENDIIKKL